MYDDILGEQNNGIKKPKKDKNIEPCYGFKNCKNKEFNIYDEECKKCIMNGDEG